MITEKDLQEAISECLGQRNPNASTCIKLAAFYTIRDAMFGKGTEQYSFSAAPEIEPEPTIRNNSGSEFSKAINGRPQAEIWPLMDEMMETIHAIHPRLYSAVMDRLR